MREHYPVAYDDKNRICAIFRYNDARRILNDYLNFSSDPQKLKNIESTPSAQSSRSRRKRPSLHSSDPPIHSRLRNIISPFFSFDNIAKLETNIERTTNELLNQVIERGRMDLIKDLAYRLSVTVIAQLLGIPIEDYSLIKRWADCVVGLEAGGSNVSTNNNTNVLIDPNFQANLRKVQKEMDLYFNNIIEIRKKVPQEDLITRLTTAEMDVGHTLTKQQTLAFCSLLVLAGHITSVNLIGNTIWSLLDFPHEFKRIKRHRFLIPSAIEETLRFKSPVQALLRFTTAEANIGGQKIPSGQRVIVFIGSANHDESVFNDPESFVTDRHNSNAHLAFGYGVHFCLGAPLARLETHIVLKTIIDRLHDLILEPECKEKLRPLHNFFFQGVSSLPLDFRPGPIKKV
jgi:cytochrome P450